jgi:N-acetylglutamate synthase-like GNAT family acetyltransferase
VIDYATSGDIDEIVRIVNAAYDKGETGIWQPEWKRTNTEWIAEDVAKREIAVAREGGTILGCIRVVRLREDTAEFGQLAVAPEGWGQGVGRALIDYAERAHDVDWMELELLVPHAPHEHKRRLHEWYTRLGYREAGRRPFPREYQGDQLAAPADLVTYRKRLRLRP